MDFVLIIQNNISTTKQKGWHKLIKCNYRKTTQNNITSWFKIYHYISIYIVKTFLISKLY